MMKKLTSVSVSVLAITLSACASNPAADPQNSIPSADNSARPSVSTTSSPSAIGEGLSITKDATPLQNRQLLGGTVGNPILRLNLRAGKEAANVTDLHITSALSTANSIDRLDLYKEGEGTAFASATKDACGTGSVPANTFCAQMSSRQLVIGQNLSQVISVFPRMKQDVTGGVSGEAIQLTISNQAGSEAVVAIGDESKRKLGVNNATITGERHVTTLSKFTSILNVSPDRDGTAVPTGVSPFGQFMFTMDSHSNSLNGPNNAVLNDLIFNVDAKNVKIAADSFTFYNKNDRNSVVSCTAQSPAGKAIKGDASDSFLVVCSNLASSAVNVKLEPGSRQNFVLSGDVVSGGTASTLQVSLTNFSNPTFTEFSAKQSHIRWTDLDTGATKCGSSTSCPFLWIEHPEGVVKSTSYGS